MKTVQGMQTVFKFAATVVLVFFFSVAAVMSARADDSAVKAQGLVDKSRITFESFMADPAMTWIHEHLKDAKGVMIIPQMLKGGLIIGGSGGSGVFLAHDEKTGEWSEPAFYTIGSVSFGLQIGASAAEIVMLVMSNNAVNALLKTGVNIGGDVSAAIGPTGAGAGAKGITADIISFARAKGAYIGASIEGAVVDTGDSMNDAYYGKPVTPEDILIKNAVSNSKSAELREALRKAAQGKKETTIKKEIED